MKRKLDCVNIEKQKKREKIFLEKSVVMRKKKKDDCHNLVKSSKNSPNSIITSKRFHFSLNFQILICYRK
jgi:hypothetical protein